MYARTQLRGGTSTARRRKGVSAVRRRGGKSPSGVRSTIRRIAPIVTIPRASESEEPAARKRKRKKKKDGEKARAMFHVSRHEQSSASDVAGTLGRLSDRARIDRPTSFYQSFALSNRRLLRDSRDVLDPQPSSPTAAPKAARTIIVAIDLPRL